MFKAFLGRVTRAWWLSLLLVAVGAIALEAAPFAYVPNTQDSTISVIDIATNTVTATVTLRGAFAVAITPDGAFAYVANMARFPTVSVLDIATNTVVATVLNVPRSPEAVAIAPDGAFAYVVNNEAGAVTVIDTDPLSPTYNTVVAIVNVGLCAQFVAITPDSAFAYVTVGCFTPTIPTLPFDYVSVINTATKTVVATVLVGNFPVGVAITPDGAFAYVTNGLDTVSVIATATNTLVATVPVGIRPVRVAFTPDGAFAYVTNFYSNSVSVIATATNTVVATVPVGRAPFDVAITPCIPFASFSAKAGVGLSAGSFDVNGTFTLGTGSGGINPLTQPVTLKVGGFTTRIPAGSFVQTPKGKFVFEGIGSGVALEVNITPQSDNTFAFRTEGAGALNLPTTNPVSVGLTIGNNCGSNTVTADIQ
jgi:YVTN family beta-propeller protein